MLEWHEWSARALDLAGLPASPCLEVGEPQVNCVWSSRFLLPMLPMLLLLQMVLVRAGGYADYLWPFLQPLIRTHETSRPTIHLSRDSYSPKDTALPGVLYS